MMNIIKNNKHKVLLIIISLLILLSIIITITYAFFGPPITKPSYTPANVTGETADQLIFVENNTFDMKPGSHNLNENTGNYSATVNPTVVLKAANEITGAIGYYDVLFFVGTNEYSYSTGDLKTPELLLTIIDPNGNEVTEVDGLNHFTIDGVSGFDITDANNIYKIKLNNKIESFSSSGYTDEWSFTITMLNLNVNQNVNRDKTFKSNIIMRSDEVIDKYLVESVLLSNGGKEIIEAKGNPVYSVLPTTNEGLFAMNDTYGTSYYYRGTVDNNWVLFAGHYWRIIRINGDNSIRLIYQGTDAPIETENVIYKTSGIGSSAYNLKAENYSESVGYMFNVYDQHGYREDSTIKEFVDLWYENNMLEYSTFLSDALFCNDRTLFLNGTEVNLVGTTWGSTHYFGSSYRVSINQPSLTCDVKNDNFTVADTNVGNGALTYPIGLPTQDEMYLAQQYMSNVEITMSPNTLYYSKKAWSPPTLTINMYYDGPQVVNDNIKPVINLKSSTLVTGSGSWDDPYDVEFD